MRKIEFHKYQGNGNDFILIDNRKNAADHLEQKTITALCHRRFGIGADGLILLNKSNGYDFAMKYYNADGNESTMCGNGGRCMIKFANALGIISDRTRFLAIDGEHEGVIRNDGIVMLKMQEVHTHNKSGEDIILNTGSPHYVTFVPEVGKINVADAGRTIRNSRDFVKEGINVNFVEAHHEKLKVRTYERGVEDETLSCGTGVVASALASSLKTGSREGRNSVFLSTPGGEFEVSFVKSKDDAFSDVWLIGPATYVYKGEIEI